MLPLLIAVALCIAAYFYLQSTKTQRTEHKEVVAAALKSPAAVTATSEESSPSEAKFEVETESTSLKGTSIVSAVFPKRILIAYSTMKGNSRQLSHKLFSSIIGARYPTEAITAPEVHDLKDVDLSKLHVSYDLVIFILSTYTGGTPPEGYEHIYDDLKDMVQDFRVPRDHFAPLTDAAKRRKRENNDNDSQDDTNVDAAAVAEDGKYKNLPVNTAARHPPQFAIFGLGDVAYGADFNRFAKDVDTSIKALGGRTVTPSVFSSEARLQPLFKVFTGAVLKFIDKKWMPKYDKLKQREAGGESFDPENDTDDVSSIATVISNRGGKRKGVHKTVEEMLKEAPLESDSEEAAELSDADEEGEEEPAVVANNDVDEFDSEDAENNGAVYNDIEDAIADGEIIGGMGVRNKKKGKLVYPRLEKNLTKQGYTVLGSHSAVKLCRWTKSMLRGRGGCYKHTFYNISSFQCMEMTPSLACANKCVFCWRHHTNPVGRSFDWEYDSPEFLIENSLAQHRRMIKQMKGVPGVQPERLQEAMNVKHCALSLVGEPIMYPEINKYVGLLHQNRISSFMVTNAQWPDRIRDLAPVTQMYLSVDASTKEDMKRIDRPIFEDFWERCLGSIDELALKRQRTVFRLTLVNDYNIENVKGYAAMVKKGMPDFIEVKGVTYCGTSDASTLTMKHVPFHEEVVQFCVDLCNAIAEDGNNDDVVLPSAEDGAEAMGVAAAIVDREYEIACEHEHSCCMLIARKQFKINGIWHTWIDYNKFMELYDSGRTDFTSLEYAAPTPAWATFNSEQRGFDPREQRFKRNKPISASC